MELGIRRDCLRCVRIPWLSFTAVATLALLAVVNLSGRTTLPQVAAPQPIEQVLNADAALKRKGASAAASTLAAPIAPAAPTTPADAPIIANAVAPSSLIIPVAGVTRNDLTDTWGQARSEGRTHEGIDIMVPMGTPVLAAGNGRIVRFFDSVRGGITIYEFDTSERFVYYYAHLSSRAAGLAEGATVRQGQVIGFVGMTGNAPVAHLHFEIERLGADKKWWHAEATNPYPLLMLGATPSA